MPTAARRERKPTPKDGATMIAMPAMTALKLVTETDKIGKRTHGADKFLEACGNQGRLDHAGRAAGGTRSVSLNDARVGRGGPDSYAHTTMGPESPGR